MQTTWQRTHKITKIYPKLENDISTDIAIIGGGITGVTCAYLLAKAGKKVVVIEKGTLEKNSTTAYTTAFLCYEIDTSFQKLVKIFGKEAANAVCQSGKDAIDQIEQIIKEENIDCDFIRVNQYKIKNLPLDIKSYEVIPNQAKFHPLKYVDWLRGAAEKYGAKFYENTKALEIEGNKIKAESGIINFDHVIVATYNPFNKPRELFGMKGMYVSYVLELAAEKSILPEGLYIDSHNPYHYVRVDSGTEKDTIILGGEDHRKEIPISPEKNWKALQKYADKIIGKGKYEIITKWDGPILESSDGLPWIGQYSKKFPNRYVATAFSGNGMTYSMIAAQIIKDKIFGRENKYTKVYDAIRHYSIKAAFLKGADYVKEFIGGALKNLFK